METTRITEAAKEAGFVAVGFTRPGTPPFYDRFREWIARGRHGGMDWLSRHAELREDSGRLLPGCRTVISLAYPYGPHKPATPDGLTAARYTEPGKRDYHDRLRKLAGEVARHVLDRFPGEKTRICVDSAPILERSIAYASGIGFIGKNTSFIIPGYGSYVFLAEVLTTAALEFPDPEPLECRCGSCTRCLDACPAGAITAPFSVDASRCLSYLTIEHRGPVGPETGDKMGDCFFGCDACQEVCPFNRGEREKEPSLPPAAAILEMDEKAFGGRFGKTAFSRAGLEKIKENIRAIRRQKGA